MCFANANPQAAGQFARAPGITSGIGLGFQAAAANRAGIPFSQIGQGGQQQRPSPQQQTQGGSLLGAPAPQQQTQGGSLLGAGVAARRQPRREGGQR